MISCSTIVDESKRRVNAFESALPCQFLIMILENYINYLKFSVRLILSVLLN